MQRGAVLHWSPTISFVLLHHDGAQEGVHPFAEWPLRRAGLMRHLAIDRVPYTVS